MNLDEKSDGNDNNNDDNNTIDNIKNYYDHHHYNSKKTITTISSSSSSKKARKKKKAKRISVTLLGLHYKQIPQNQRKSYLMFTFMRIIKIVWNGCEFNRETVGGGLSIEMKNKIVI